MNEKQLAIWVLANKIVKPVLPKSHKKRLESLGIDWSYSGEISELTREDVCELWYEMESIMEQVGTAQKVNRFKQTPVYTGLRTIYLEFGMGASTDNLFGEWTGEEDEGYSSN